MTGKFLLAIAACAIASSALANDHILLSQNKLMVYSTAHTATKTLPSILRISKAHTIFNSLASAYPNGLYYANSGDTICGATCGFGSEYAQAAQFTPASSATAAEIILPVGSIEGTDNVSVAIYSDNNGIPGAPLWTGVSTTLPAFGVCCGTNTLKIKGGLALTGGTPYWVVVFADAAETTTVAAWETSTTDQVHNVNVAYNYNNQGWSTYQTNLPPAFGIFSK